MNFFRSCTIGERFALAIPFATVAYFGAHLVASVIR